MRALPLSLRLIFTISLGLLLASTIRGQITEVTNGTSTPMPGTGHDYIHMLGETVNPANGSVSLRVKVPVPPGRGLTLPFAFAYDSNGVYTPQGDGIGSAGLWPDPGDFFHGSGWSYTVPLQSNVGITTYDSLGNINCILTTGYAFQDSAGTRYGFHSLVGFQHLARMCTGDVDETSDSVDFYHASMAGCGQSVIVSDVKNTTYTFPGSTCNDTGGDTVTHLPTTIVDRNGNIVTISNPSKAIFTVTDTFGRTVLSSSGFGATGNTVTVSGLSQPYTLTWGSSSATFSPGFTRDNPNQWCPSNFTGPGGNGGGVTAIALPNGKQYTFSYDPTYGLVSKITYPTGGYVSYSWALNTRSDYAQVPDINGNPQSCDYTYDTPALAHRYVSFDGSTIALQQDFSYSTTWNSGNATWASKQTIVTTHDLVQGITYQTVYNYTPITVPTSSPFLPSHFGGQIPMEQTITYKGSSGNTLRTVSKTWWDQYLIKSDQTTLDSGQTSQVNLTWTGALIAEKDEYDFGLTLLKKTIYSYGGGFDQPCQTTVYDGNGNRLAETDSLFDNVTTLCASPTSVSTSAVSNLPTGTHDETNYGPASTRSRGNATTVTKQCFQGAQACASGNLATTFTYDETGQVLTSTDPNGKITQFSYADSYTVLSGGVNVNYTPTANTNAFLTTITDPLSHTQNFTYDFNNGQLTVSKDQNNLTTTYIYNDSLNRPTSTTRPDGGQSTIAYNDTTQTVTTTKKINASQSIPTVAIADGVGHVKQTQLTSDPQGTVYTDTAYDGLGRAYTASNPYRSGSDPTTSRGTTTYFYDELGRKCLEVPPDGTLPSGGVCPTTQPANTILTVYSGNIATVTDQTGKSRKSLTDGLGRLIQVFEDPVGLNYETDYGYDALGNLLCAAQKGTNSGAFTNCTSIPAGWHPRTFTYDSLSRLLSSANPETGTITYKYDSDSNCASPNTFLGLLVSKTDARGIRTCAQYDAINRQTARNYSNGDPTITTTYDQANCLGLSTCQNIGQRTSETDAAGSEAWAYDIPDRMHKEQRTTSGITKPTTYNLDYAGNVTSVVYPTSRVVNYTYDAANRPSTAVDGSNGITYATDFQTAPAGCLAGAVCYTPQGTFYALSIGRSSAFTGLNLTHTYNSRLQPNAFKASSSSGNAIDITYSFIDSVTTHNAGHVNTITNNLDTTRSQNFYYDSLNRITSALTTSTYSTSPAHCWGETYTPDAWGNLNSIAATTNPNYTGCTQESGFSSFADGNNHLFIFSYDLSGNTSSDGVVPNYQWDGESQLKSAAGVTYTYDGDGRRVSKVGSKLYWYGSGGDILAETNASGNTTAEYIFFGGKRIAMLPTGGNPVYYVEDMLGTSRVVTTNTGVVCYDADFYPYGGERSYTNTCPQNYKFEGKERDNETGNDDFGARYYSNRFGRWLSADWSAVPAPVPYANLTNPQTLNLYSMVADDPESFADLDGHTYRQTYQLAVPGGGSFWDPMGATCMFAESGLTEAEFNLLQAAAVAQAVAQQQPQNQNPINVSITVTKEPQIFENLQVGKENVTGVGAQLGITFTDSSGKPLAGASVTEKNSPAGLENPGAVTTNSKGTINDYVLKAGPSATMPPGGVAGLKDFVTTNPITVKTTQTLTITAGKQSYQATYTRTLTNVGANGKLNTNFNSHGVNFTISFTKPVITTSQ